MVESLSDAYYVDRFPVAFHPGQASYLDEDSHSELNEEVYLSRDSEDEIAIARKEQPLVMKIGSHHLLVHPHEEVPAGTLAVPEHVSPALDQTESEHPVYIAKKGTAERLVTVMSGSIR